MGEDLTGGHVSERDAVENMAAARKLVEDLVDVLHQAGHRPDFKRVHGLIKTMHVVVGDLAAAKMLGAVAITMLTEEREQAGPRLALGEGK